MNYRKLGTSGMNASVVGLGTWAVGGWMWGGCDEREAIAAINRALDDGINLVDTAPIYGFGRSESLVGKAIAGRRDEVLLATKCGLVWHTEKGMHYFNSDDDHPSPDAAQWHVYKHLGPESISYEVEQSLKRLNTDHIDLYQTHWQESTTAICDTMAALESLRDQGKIRAIGVSNASPEQMDQYLAAGRIDSDQELYSMLDRGREEDNLPYCREHDLAFLAYSPLAMGLLTGKLGPERHFPAGDQRSRKPRFTVENRRRVQALLTDLAPLAADLGLSLAQLTIAWTLAQPGCSHVLVGARRPDQAAENARAGAADLPPDIVRQANDLLSAHSKDIV